MQGTIDLHCHLLPGIDDGTRDPEDAVAITSSAAPARSIVTLRSGSGPNTVTIGACGSSDISQPRWPSP
jgi:hypothetical protein